MDRMQKYQLLFAAASIVLIILGANGVLKVPQEAVTLITSVLLGGNAAVNSANKIAAGMALKNAENLPTSIVESMSLTVGKPGKK